MELMDITHLLAGANGSAEKQAVSEETARELLTHAYEKLNEQNYFKEGQIVRKKIGLEDALRDWRGGVAIFIRYGAPQYRPMEHGNPVAQNEPNCVVGVLTSDNAMIEHAVCSRYLEPAPADE